MLFKTESIKKEGSFINHDIERLQATYSDCSTRFSNVTRDFSKQYAHIYSARLNTFRNILGPIALQKWSNKYKIFKLCDVRDKENMYIIIGTLFKLQELKPSILKELSDQLEIIPQPTRTHFVHQSDSLVLEDELQRIKLVGDCININTVVTGVVCAVLGSEQEDGIFKTKDICFADCNIQKPLPKCEEEKYIVLVSGLNMASKTADQLFPLHLLLEWLSGISGTTEYQQELSKIVRVIIAGGVFANHSNEIVLNESDVIASASTVDAFCAAICAVSPMDLMPGCKDPSGIMLPQKPFHYCLFPKAIEYKSFNRVPNPYECEIAGVTCLGTSGEPIKDIMRYSEINTHMDALKSTLKWRHLAPTCPDTVPCTPCTDTDPFVIYNCPHIYFSGNADEFATELYKGDQGQNIRLICVPDFCKTYTVAVVNLLNLDCYSMTFGS